MVLKKGAKHNNNNINMISQNLNTQASHRNSIMTPPQVQSTKVATASMVFMSPATPNHHSNNFQQPPPNLKTTSSLIKRKSTGVRQQQQHDNTNTQHLLIVKPTNTVVSNELVVGQGTHYQQVTSVKKSVAHSRKKSETTMVKQKQHSANVTPANRQIKKT